MKKIALDLDGVVFDSENLYRVYAEIYDVDKYKMDTVIDNREKTFQKRYRWNKSDYKEFYDKYSREILENASLMPGSSLVISKLKEKFKIIIVTSRSNMETELARNGLDEIGLSDVPVFCNQSYKVDKFIQEEVHLIVDDDPEICLEAAKNGITALYFKNNASDILMSPNVVNVNNWGEIYKYLILKDKC